MRLEGVRFGRSATRVQDGSVTLFNLMSIWLIYIHVCVCVCTHSSIPYLDIILLTISDYLANANI